MDDRVAGNLTEIRCTHLPDLGGDRVLLDERLAGKMNLEGVVGGQRHGQAPSKKLGEGIPVVVQEERVVGEWTHHQSNLGHVVQILQTRRLAQVDAVCNVLGQEKCGREVVEVACLAAVRPEGKRVEAPALAQLIQREQVRIHVVCVVGIRRVVLDVPLGRRGHVLGGAALGLAFVVDQVKPADVLQEDVQHGMRLRIDCRLKHWQEDVVQELLEVFQDTLSLVHVVQTRDLDHPQVVVRIEPVLHDPRRQRVPFHRLPAVYGNPVLGELVFGALQVVEHLLGQLGQEPPADDVLLLDEYLAQPRLPERVVLQVELVKPVKDVLVRVHV
mmetsp:Transcript_1039/g.3140  ORF Transcript_1039/g.3140 Transcript_1039/m.3140 type:complete len:329 (-) Transcript_1039:1783-2769(-)